MSEDSKLQVIANYKIKLNNSENKINELYKIGKLIEPKEFIHKNCTFDESETEILVDERVYVAFKKMESFVRELGYKIFIDSGFRSFKYQSYILNMYREKYGKELGEKLCAYPGESEHQLGLAIDLGFENENGEYISSITEEAKVFEILKNNSYKFGFILRYMKGKENITKYNFEPWHYRFVGKRLAKILYENNICLEEYYFSKEKYDK